MLCGSPFSPKMREPMDDYLRHEALDRAHLMASMVGDFLISHPYIEADKAHSRRARKAMKNLAALYQEIGLGEARE